MCRKHGISDATFYNWRSKYGGMEVSDARRLKELEDENAKLKKLLAESMIDNATLREMLEKTSEARFKESCRDLGHDEKGVLAAPGLPPGRARPEDRSLSHPAVRDDAELREADCGSCRRNVAGSAIAACTSCSSGRAST